MAGCGAVGGGGRAGVQIAGPAGAFMHMHARMHAQHACTNACAHACTYACVHACIRTASLAHLMRAPFRRMRAPFRRMCSIATTEERGQAGSQARPRGPGEYRDRRWRSDALCIPSAPDPSRARGIQRAVQVCSFGHRRTHCVAGELANWYLRPYLTCPQVACSTETTNFHELNEGVAHG